MKKMTRDDGVNLIIVAILGGVLWLSGVGLGYIFLFTLLAMTLLTIKDRKKRK